MGAWAQIAKHKNISTLYIQNKEYTTYEKRYNVRSHEPHQTWENYEIQISNKYFLMIIQNMRLKNVQKWDTDLCKYKWASRISIQHVKNRHIQQVATEIRQNIRKTAHG